MDTSRENADFILHLLLGITSNQIEIGAKRDETGNFHEGAVGKLGEVGLVARAGAGAAFSEIAGN